jgi:type IV pilus assembly protein PilA
MKNNKQSGFTLIEILVVIGLIAILAAIVIIAINPARQFAQARDTQRRSDVNAILNAVGQYIADNKGAVPTGITSDGTDYTISSSGAKHVDLCTYLVANTSYLSALPTDPNTVPYAGASKGDAVNKANCGTYDTGYLISQDTAANGARITVKATGEITNNISITR